MGYVTYMSHWMTSLAMASVAGVLANFLMCWEAVNHVVVNYEMKVMAQMNQ